MADRNYPDRPFLAVSAAIFRDERVLVVRRARSPTGDIFTLPGGVVEAGETLAEAILREVTEETGLTIELAGLAGYRDVIFRDSEERVEGHFVVLAFAARWMAGEIRPNNEIAEGQWLRPSELGGLATTEGLDEIIASAASLIDRQR